MDFLGDEVVSYTTNISSDADVHRLLAAHSKQLADDEPHQPHQAHELSNVEKD